MIIAEMQTEGATVRIHDEFFASVSQGSLEHISQIITDSYKRRNAEKEENLRKE